MVADRKEAHPVEKEKPGRTNELQRTNPPPLWKRITRKKKRSMLTIWQNNLRSGRVERVGIRKSGS